MPRIPSRWGCHTAAESPTSFIISLGSWLAGLNDCVFVASSDLWTHSQLAYQGRALARCANNLPASPSTVIVQYLQLVSNHTYEYNDPIVFPFELVKYELSAVSLSFK